MLQKDNFKHLIYNEIYQILKPIGFNKKGDSFFTIKNNNWGIINFQKSTGNTKEKIKFTINIGIASRAIFDFYYPDVKHDPPSVWNCHYRQRAGYLLPERSDIWWEINISTSIQPMFDKIKNIILEYALPAVNNNISDEALINIWLSGSSPGLGTFDRLMNLCVLLYKAGRDNELKDVLDELQGIRQTPYMSVAIKRLIDKISNLKNK